MKEHGTKPPGLETGNAWELRYKDMPFTNWVVGEMPHTPKDSLRFVPQETAGHPSMKAQKLAMKWFVHDPATDDPKWGESKKTSAGRTISLLAGDGEFVLEFRKDKDVFQATLDQSGDFAIWGPGLEHSWKPMMKSTIITLRFEPLPEEKKE